MNKTNEPLPEGTEFFSCGDGTWDVVHRFDRHSGECAVAVCGAHWKAGHVTGVTAERYAEKPCRECVGKSSVE